jgi:hypothetical protein
VSSRKTVHLTRRQLWLQAVALTAALLPTAARAKRDVVPVPEWTQFDGAHWGSLTLGETTQGVFTERFSSRATDTPGLLLGNTSRRARARVLAVFAGANPEARLEWVTLLREEDKPLAPEALIQHFGSEYTERFPHPRALDWRLWIFPRRGVAAVVERGAKGNDRSADQVAGFIFARPQQMTALAARLPETETPVTAVTRQDEEEPLEARVGRVSVSADRDGDISFDRDRLEDTVESRVQLELSSRGPVVFNRNADGRVSVQVRVRRRPDRKGSRRVTVDVSSSINAEGTDGSVTGYGSASRDLEGDVTSGRIRSRAADAAVEATEQAARSVRRSMESGRAEARTNFIRGQMLELTKMLLRTGRTPS